MWLWDALAYLFCSFVLGAFVFWLAAYFTVEGVRYLFSGPSEQLKTVGTSILNEPPLEARMAPPLRRVA